MMTPQQWITALSSDKSDAEAYGAVGRHVRQWLKVNVWIEDTITTHELVEAIFPKAFAKQSEAGAYAHKRFIRALTAKNGCRTNDLHDCWTAGPKETRRVWGRRLTFNRPLWHAPKGEV